MSPLAEDTIAAIATPLGQGGLGVVRLSGPKALEIADLVFQTQGKCLSAAATHTLHHGWIKDGDEVLDEAVVSIFKSPASYTGEDVVEFSCHGSPTVLLAVSELCCRSGARQAKPGEFTERAFLNGKLDLTQAEAVADLIHARSRLSRLAAAHHLKGGLSAQIDRIRKPLIELLAHLEGNLDFAEEGIPLIEKNDAGRRLDETITLTENLLNTSFYGRFLREGLRIAIVGRPNVGKSSLFNAFLNQDRAIVTEVPGTTRDFLEENIQWDGLPVVLIDTAGLRDTQDRVEKVGLERSQKALERADVTLFVVDGSEPPTTDDRSVWKLLAGKKTVVALNKSDRPAKWTSVDKNLFFNAPVVPVSATAGTGLDTLQLALKRLIIEEKKETEDAVVITNERHRRHLEEALARLRLARTAYTDGKSEEAIGVDLREALRQLGLISGFEAGPEILDTIFRTFCIGK